MRWTYVATSVAIVAATSVAIVAATFAMAQPQTNSATRAGSVEHIKVHGKSLEGNLESDSTDRDVTIYLPPSYATQPTRRYPVLYLLHGYNGTDRDWTWLPDIADKLVAVGTLPEIIVVMPNAFTLHKGSMYSNSVTTGDWETYLAHDLISYVDAHYRTIPDRESRGLAGFSMGGYGAIRIGMKRPDAFSSLYSLSACCLSPQQPHPKTIANASLNLAMAAAWSPNPTNPPLYLDLPTKDGKLRPDTVAKWVANAPLAMIDRYAPSLKTYRAGAIDIGTSDHLLASNRGLDQAMTRLGIPHTYQEYDAGHSNRLLERVECDVLPFFSKNLSFRTVAFAGRTSRADILKKMAVYEPTR